MERDSQGACNGVVNDRFAGDAQWVSGVDWCSGCGGRSNFARRRLMLPSKLAVAGR